MGGYTIKAKCRDCGASGDLTVELPRPPGPLACPACGGLPSWVGVHSLMPWVEDKARYFELRMRRGEIGTRKQDYKSSEFDTSVIGLAAELAGCFVMCPNRIPQYMASKIDAGNRGIDLPPEWTGLDRPLEVKQTRYRTSTKGFMIVRPPRNTPGPVLREHVDDCYYLLLTGTAPTYRVDGWTDRAGFLRDCLLNPIPKSGSQRDCLGVHWSKLRPLPVGSNILLGAT
jgi:hypothetical protein